MSSIGFFLFILSIKNKQNKTKNLAHFQQLLRLWEIYATFTLPLLSYTKIRVYEYMCINYKAQGKNVLY